MENLFLNDWQVVGLGRINREQMPKTSGNFLVQFCQQEFIECSRKFNRKPIIPVKKVFQNLRVSISPIMEEELFSEHSQSVGS